MLSLQSTLWTTLSYHKSYFDLCDNINAIYLFDNLVQHQHIKHTEMDKQFMREKVTCGQVSILHIPSRFQIVDIFTNELMLQLFDDFWDSLNIRSPLVWTMSVTLYFY